MLLFAESDVSTIFGNKKINECENIPRKPDNNINFFLFNFCKQQLNIIVENTKIKIILLAEINGMHKYFPVD